MNKLLVGDVAAMGSLAVIPDNGATAKKDDPKSIAKAASQFEALLIGELLKSARESEGGGWMGTDESEAGSTLMELSEQELSSALASKGGLGMAKLIESGLSKSSHKPASQGY